MFEKHHQLCNIPKLSMPWPKSEFPEYDANSFFMPPTSKTLTGHIGFGLSVRPSVRASVHPCMLGFWNFIYGFLMEKCLTHVFFSCPSYLPFWSYAPSNKIRMKSDACHILWTVHARVLKFDIWIPHGKIADPICFFFCPNYLPFWSYAPLKKSEWNLVSKISQKVFELGAWNLVSW